MVEPAQAVATPMQRLGWPWIRAADYPDLSLHQLTAGNTAVVYQAGADGRVRNCRVGISSGAALLDAAVCKALRENARFEPARAADGTALETIATLAVSWRVAH